jgi:hypothetical protein
MSSNPQAAPLSSGRRMSSLSRLFAVFFSPAEAFADIAREPHFVLAWIVEIAAGLIGIYAVINKVGVDAILRQTFAQLPNRPVLSPAQMAVAVNRTTIRMWISPPLGVVLGTLILAALLMAAINFGYSQDIRYKQSVAIVAHAYLPLVLGGLLTAAVFWFAADPTSIDFQNPVGTNLGYFFTKASVGAAANVFLTRLDLLSFWVMGLLALGYTKAGTKLKFASALTPILILWAVYVLAITGISALVA